MIALSLYTCCFFYSEHWSTLEGRVFVEDGSGCTIPWDRGYPEGAYYLAEAAQTQRYTRVQEVQVVK